MPVPYGHRPRADPVIRRLAILAVVLFLVGLVAWFGALYLYSNDNNIDLDDDWRLFGPDTGDVSPLAVIGGVMSALDVLLGGIAACVKVYIEVRGRRERQDTPRPEDNQGYL